MVLETNMQVSIVELSNDNWSIVIRFGKYTLTSFTESFPSTDELQAMMDNIRSKAKDNL